MSHEFAAGHELLPRIAELPLSSASHVLNSCREQSGLSLDRQDSGRPDRFRSGVWDEDRSQMSVPTIWDQWQAGRLPPVAVVIVIGGVPRCCRHDEVPPMRFPSREQAFRLALPFMELFENREDDCPDDDGGGGRRRRRRGQKRHRRQHRSGREFEPREQPYSHGRGYADMPPGYSELPGDWGRAAYEDRARQALRPDQRREQGERERIVLPPGKDLGQVLSGRDRDIGRLRPGTTLVVPPGDYVINSRFLNFHGTREHPIRIVGMPGARLHGSTGRATMRIDDSENFSIEGFNFAPRSSRIAQALLVTNSRGFNISDNVMGFGGRNTRDSSPLDLGGHNSDVRIQRNEIHVTEGRLAGHGIYIGEGESVNVRVQDNVIHHWGDGTGSMIQVNSNGRGTHQNILIQGNTLISRAGRGEGRGGGFALSGARNVWIRENTVRLMVDQDGRAGDFVQTWGGPVLSAYVGDNDMQFVDSYGRIVERGNRGKTPFVLSEKTEMILWSNGTTDYRFDHGKPSRVTVLSNRPERYASRGRRGY